MMGLEQGAFLRSLKGIRAMEYVVQRGDTNEAVTRRLNTNWHRLKRLNPDAVGRSAKTGRWFLKEGATVCNKPGFQEELGRVVTGREAGHAKENTQSAKRYMEYTIRKGDTLWDLAVHNGLARVLC